MTQVIDRRINGKNKSAVNRQKFIRRYKKHLKEAVSKRSITNIEHGEKIYIPAKDIAEPTFGIGSGGKQEIVSPGNKEFVTGDRLPRPQDGKGRDDQASDSGEGEDDFSFALSREEFMEIFFEDLELPDLIKTQLTNETQFKKVRAGYTTSGTPSNINIVRSLKGSIARRIALTSPHKQRLKQANEALEQLLKQGLEDEDERITALREEIIALEKRIKRTPFIDTFDLRYNNRIDEAVPTTQAVMFCLMDVSGSMGKYEKDIAKRFFTLLYLFLTRTYEQIEVVFIRHHTVAKEVDEQEFFYSRETGGTVVSSALKLMHDTIIERYPSSDWNIYAAQASDGDNWSDDSPLCRDLLIKSIMPWLQYYTYIEIAENSPPGNLWKEYQNVAAVFQSFASQRIADPAEIYPVFRKLFEKQWV